MVFCQLLACKRGSQKENLQQNIPEIVEHVTVGEWVHERKSVSRGSEVPG